MADGCGRQDHQQQAQQARMDTWLVALTALLGIAGLAAFFVFSQPAQVKTRSNAGGMKPRGAHAARSRAQTWCALLPPTPPDVGPRRGLAQAVNNVTDANIRTRRVGPPGALPQPALASFGSSVLVGFER